MRTWSIYQHFIIYMYLSWQPPEEDDGETVQFLNKRTFQFVAELSEGSESDPVTVLNMVMVTAANKFRDSPYFVS